MTPLRIFTLALPLLLATTVSVWTASAPTPDCRSALTISDPQLRAVFAAIDRDRDIESKQVCALYRARTTTG